MDPRRLQGVRGVVDPAQVEPRPAPGVEDVALDEKMLQRPDRRGRRWPRRLVTHGAVGGAGAGPDPLGGQSVARFIEKPTFQAAREIVDAGGLWNAFIVAAGGAALINLFLPRYAALLMEMQVIVSRALGGHSPAAGWPAIVDMYERLPHVDFSRDLLEGQESALCVMRVPPCGWSDLGTPRRVGETLRRLRPRDPGQAAALAAQLRSRPPAPGLDIRVEESGGALRLIAAVPGSK